MARVFPYAARPVLGTDVTGYVEREQHRVLPLASRAALYDAEDQAFTSHGRSFHRFEPAHYARTKLLTAEVLDDLRSGKSILSVGAGEGHLERFLREVTQSPITLADRDARLLPNDFPSFVFDMNNLWPHLGTYDYVLFPELLFPPENRDTASWLADITRNACNVLNLNGSVRMSGFVATPEVHAAVFAKFDGGIEYYSHPNRDTGWGTLVLRPETSSLFPR